MPKRKNAKVAERYTGRLQVKQMVQQRQWRKQHVDAHYGACIFRYLRECALLFREFCAFACVDDKHRVKIGEPSCPVAAAERGRQVLVRSGTSFQVSDHDFTRFSAIPSVSLMIDVPDAISESWYEGDVHVLYKDSAFEPSSPIRHAAELTTILRTRPTDSPILFLYSDGGPDHRLTYMSVKLSLISLFIELDLDYLLAARTAPYHSFRNPAERVMSVLNLGLQSVGVACCRMEAEMEAIVSHSNSVAEIRRVAKDNPTLKEALLDSVTSAKTTLTAVTLRLQLKGKKFSVDVAAQPDELCQLWSTLKKIDPSFTIEHSDKVSVKSLTPKLKEFLSHCCNQRHYFFEIKKCGESTCQICSPVRMPAEEFAKLKRFPDPVPNDTGHYKPFSEVYGTTTTEDHRPSNIEKRKKAPLHASVQNVKNSGIMLL